MSLQSDVDFTRPFKVPFLMPDDGDLLELQAQPIVVGLQASTHNRPKRSAQYGTEAIFGLGIYPVAYASRRAIISALVIVKTGRDSLSLPDYQSGRRSGT